MAIAEVLAEGALRGVGPERGILRSRRRGKCFEVAAAGASAGKDEPEAAGVVQAAHGSDDGWDVMGEAEIAGVEEGEGPEGREGAGGDEEPSTQFSATTIFSEGMPRARRRSAHAGSEGDDAIGAAAAEIGESADGAIDREAGGEDAEGDGDIGIEVHFPDEVPGAAEVLGEGAGRGRAAAGW